MQTLYWASENQYLRWQEFAQYPLCDYAYNYTVFLKQSAGTDSTPSDLSFSEIRNLPDLKVDIISEREDVTRPI